MLMKWMFVNFPIGDIILSLFRFVFIVLIPNNQFFL